MKKLRLGVCLALILVMLVCNCGVQTYAEVLSGEREYTAIELKLGKSKTAKMQKGKDGVYFKVSIEEIGKLKVAVDAEKIGTNLELEVYKKVDDLTRWNQSATLKYSKSKKKATGTLTSDYVLTKGTYIIKLTPGKELKSVKKVKVTAKLIDTAYDDVEPNFPETNAQSMDVKGKKTYKMLISRVESLNDVDYLDCFTFKLKKSQKLQLKVSLKQPVEELHILVCQKQPEGIAILKEYDMSSKKLDKTLKLKKGTYFVKVWYTGNSTIQIPYEISGIAK